MRVLILGASGRVGGLAVQVALQRGHEVVAQARASSAYRPPAGAALLRADPLEAQRPVELAPFDAVVSCIGQRHVDPRNPLSPMAPPADLCARVADALVASGRPGQRVAVLSAAGVGDSLDRIHMTWRFALPRTSLASAYADLERMEAALLGSSLDVLCVRPVVLLDLGRRPARVLERAGPLARISRRSVATFLIEAAEGAHGAGAVMIG